MYFENLYIEEVIFFNFSVRTPSPYTFATTATLNQRRPAHLLQDSD